MLFGLFGPVLALVHAARAEALLPLEPYGRGLDLSLAADHYLHRAFDAEKAVLCFWRHWSSHANGTRPDFGAGAHDAGPCPPRTFTVPQKRRGNLNSVRFMRFHVEMFHEQPAIVSGHLLVVSLRDGIRRSLCATFEHLGFLAEDRKFGHRYLLVVAAEGSHDVRDLFQVGL